MKKSVISFVAGMVFGATFVCYFAEKGRRIRNAENTAKETPAVSEQEDDAEDYFEDDFEDEFKDWD